MKEQMWKKTISLLLAALMLLCLMPAGLFAEDEEIADPETALEETLAYIAETVSPVFNPDSFLSNDWEVIALARAGFEVGEGYYQGYYDSVLDALDEASDTGAPLDFGTTAKMILALTAIGVDATDFEGYNLLLPLADFGEIAYPFIADICYALLALDSKPYTIFNGVVDRTQETRDGLIDLIDTTGFC